MSAGDDFKIDLPSAAPPPFSLLPNGTGTGCLVSPEQQVGIVLSLEYTCKPGFFCPNTTSDDPASLPVSCPATPDCLFKRLYGGRACAAQGKYEPEICSGGYFCPDFKQKIECPEGSFCIKGSIEPRKCHPFAICPERSVTQTFYGGLVLCGVVDILIIVVYFALKIRDIKKRKNSVISTVTALLKSQKRAKPSRNVSRLSDTIEEKAPIEKVVVEDSADEDVTSVDLLVGAFTRGLQSHKLSIGFRFEELGLTLKSGVSILSGVTGRIKPGHMTAIMGPSGAGKTTFMNVLMGKVSRTSGKLFVNEIETEMHKLKKVIGFVPQEDIMLRELTVRQNIIHSANVRLPRTWSNKQKEEYVDNIIEALGLSGVAYNRVGDEATRGISGGQRKRVNIALELAAIPIAIFLDEPTSGLDSTAALQVAQILRNLTHLGITIVSVIHQPRVEIYNLFTDVLMIAPGGETAYMGPTTEAQPYFERLGFSFPEHGNPADVIMDILSGKGNNMYHGIVKPSELVEKWVKYTEQEAPSSDSENTNTDQEQVDKKQFIKIASSLSSERSANMFMQTIFCTKRAFSQQYALISGLYLEIFVGSFAGLLMGLAALNAREVYTGVWIAPYSQMSPSPLLYTPALLSLLMGLTAALASAPAGVKVFGEEKVVYWREAAAGHSRVAYYLGKTISTLPRIALAALHFSSIFYYLSKPVFGFPVLYGVIVMKFFGVYGLATLTSMIVERSNGPLMAVVFALFAGVFCGYGPTLNQAKDWGILFIWEISYNKWGAEILFSEFIKPYDSVFNTNLTVSAYGYTLDRNSFNFGMGFLIGFILRVFAFALLIFLNRSKQR